MRIYSLFIIIILFLVTSCKQQNSESFHKSQKDKTLRISTASDTQSLDPRRISDIPSANILRLLYEGLMTVDHFGRVVPALADSISVSEDLKTYTFKLKNATWSNGDPVTADDFAYTWKSMLTPEFPAPNAYQLFMIKGARSAKEGGISVEKVGITVKDPKTLYVELEAPTPHFVELLATHFYFPVNRRWAEKKVNQEWVFNGPFVLDEWHRYDELTVKRNLSYWDVEDVYLDKVIVMVLDDNTALRMFDNDELDWIGSPLSFIPVDAIPSLKKRGVLRIVQSAGTHWFRLNTRHAPFDNLNMRKAFAFALDRQSIVEHVLQGNQEPATKLIPPSMGLSESYFEDNATQDAWFLFQEGLKEMGLSKEELPSITLCYAYTDRNHRIAQAVQQQWQKTFDIPIQLQNCEPQILYDKMRRNDYHLSLGSWYADFHDPINFLEVFKFRNNATNSTYWEDQNYISLLDQATTVNDIDDRMDIYREAEKLIMEQLPVIPLFHGSFNYAKKHEVINVYFSELGYLDFRHADINNETVPLYD